MVIPIVLEEIRRLSQEEGLYDEEIAERLGLSRATVNRTRKQNGIPTANLANRFDKQLLCPKCKQIVTVRRNYESVICPNCRP